MAEANKNIKGTIAGLSVYHTDAYAIAVRNGYEGTEAEWLDSLVGKSAYEIAVQCGFKGTESEWIRSLKGDTGKQGEKGEKGDTGSQGVQGEKGETGATGETGVTPHIGANGNWYIGDTDTGVRAAALAEGATIVQTTGDDETAVMSQKATTEALADVSQFAENLIANGNFETTDGWAAYGGTLTVNDNIGTINTDKSNFTIRLDVLVGALDKGDKVFVKMGVKAPKGVGGSAQNNIAHANIRCNTPSGLIGALSNEKGNLKDAEWTDQYGIIEFGDAMAKPVLQYYVKYGSTNFIPDGAKVDFRGIVAVNLTKTFGAGNEPTADEFYALLDGFEDKWFDGKANLLSAESELNKQYEHSKLYHDMTVTVGESGDFLTLNRAIEYLSNFYPLYKKGGMKRYIKILAGTVINEQIYANQIDLQFITIIAEEGENNTETINIDGTPHTMVIVDVDATGFGITANAHDSRGNYPFIAGENAAKLPTIGCLFRLLPETVEAGKAICGMLCNRGSAGVVLAASGFDGFNDGVIANNESSITIREGISRNMTRWGVHARHNGEVSARSCVCTNCGIGAYADRIGDLDVREAVLNGSTVAIESNNISRANANGCHAQNCGSEGGYVVKVSGGGFANCVGLDTVGCVGTIYNVTTNTLTAHGIIFA